MLHVSKQAQCQVAMTDNVSDLLPRKIPLGLPNEQGKGGCPYTFLKAKASNIQPKVYLHLIQGIPLLKQSYTSPGKEI